MRVILITNTSKEAQALETALLNQGIELSEVIKHAPKKQQPSFFTRQFDRVRGLLIRLLFMNGQERAALKYEHECLQRSSQQIGDFIQKQKNSSVTPKYQSIEVEHLNSDGVERVIRSESPTLCVVWGTGILKKKILNAAEYFVNAHSSILPAYRGTRSEFWQCYNEEYDNLGVTIHLISRGVDTGDIIAQFPLSQQVFKEPHHLRAANTQLILEKYPEVIQAMINQDQFNGTSQVVPKESVTYKFADVTRDKILELYMRIAKQ